MSQQSCDTAPRNNATNAQGSPYLGPSTPARKALGGCSGWDVALLRVSSAAGEGLHLGRCGGEHRGPHLRAPAAQALVGDSALQRAAGLPRPPLLPESRGSAHSAQNRAGCYKSAPDELTGPAELNPDGGAPTSQIRASYH